ncbi:hypothetical protein M0R45_035676 [Rubus argutus]|uniref:Uncharacterized protein n=1 Tax=Rubus argutus TaxID=59490 RepID=A0AAW1VXL4_RUBAR
MGDGAVKRRSGVSWVGSRDGIVVSVEGCRRDMVKLWQRSCHGGAVLEARLVKLGVIEDLGEIVCDCRASNYKENKDCENREMEEEGGLR